MVAYLTPDQAVGGSSPSVFIFVELNNFSFFDINLFYGEI